MNLFIGGQILDRGVTIRNLIGFYYGRNPQKYQQDTVLQHSRMYGARPQPDLAVTRLYAPRHIYQVMQKIHDFDAALREAFLTGEHERGVYFIQKDVNDKLIPCSPNRLLFSKLTSIRPGGRLLPSGFQTVFKSHGKKKLDELDQLMDRVYGKQYGKVVVVDLVTAVHILDLAHANMEYDENEDYDDERKGQVAVLDISRCTLSIRITRVKSVLLLMLIVTLHECGKMGVYRTPLIHTKRRLSPGKRLKICLCSSCCGRTGSRRLGGETSHFGGL